MKFKKCLNNSQVYKAKNSKKRNLSLILFFIIISVICVFPITITATEESSEENYTDLYENTFQELEKYDFSGIDAIINNMDSEISFGDNFVDIVSQIINGEMDINATNIIEHILKVIISNIKQIIPICLIIICIAILIRCLHSFSPNTFKDGISDIINFVAIGIVVIFISKIVIEVNELVYSTTSTMQNIINIIFPILMTLMGVVGASSSVAIYTPITTILNTGVSNIITNYLYPIYTISFALIVVSVLTNRMKLDKFINFLNSVFKTLLGFLFTIFSSVFVIKGISAGKYDSVSIYTTKFAVKNYIPLIGSYISEGFNYLLLSSVLIKNAVGLAGIVILLLNILLPVIYIFVIKLALQFTSSIVDLLGSSSVSTLLDKVSKIMAFPLSVILGVAFMFVMTLSLVICTANLI